MRHITILFTTLLLTIMGCQKPVQNEVTFYGEEFKSEEPVASKELIHSITSDEVQSIQVTGEITGVCQKKGCWLKLPIENDQELFVKFKDYAFFVPMDAEGKEATINGTLKKETIDVATLRHYAEDAGDSPEQIALITEPEVKYTFMASGVSITD
ncbi:MULTISPECIES: DUF4920 domain-containing protein [Flammeovirga]|uniref:DUF4920 domain-containing protein n=1 Tax=Flammeovirga agarivorans TaxID=2726742 RepID=A0A7X8SPJ1_9BACT|nr:MULTISPECIES: DUF4920 domain-containing protein [Flammeovirga]NLR94026.1 DUF4920 domain-containing protein [Flammeovirga agarivorans]